MQCLPVMDLINSLGVSVKMAAEAINLSYHAAQSLCFPLLLFQKLRLDFLAKKLLRRVTMLRQSYCEGVPTMDSSRMKEFYIGFNRILLRHEFGCDQLICEQVFSSAQ